MNKVRLWAGLLKEDIRGMLALVRGSNVLVHIFEDVWPVVSLGDSLSFYSCKDDLYFIVFAVCHQHLGEVHRISCCCYFSVILLMIYWKINILLIGIPGNAVYFNALNSFISLEQTEILSNNLFLQEAVNQLEMNGVLQSGFPWSKWSITSIIPWNEMTIHLFSP